MKKMLHTLAAVLVALTAQAQPLNVSVGSVTDQYPSAQTGEMTFTGGTQMTVMGKTYDISQIGKMWTDQTQVKDNEVNVVYSGDAALVYEAGNIARYVTATVSGAHVSLTQSCYSTSSWSKSTWYAITVGNDTFAFKTPTSGGNTMVVSGASQPTLKSGVTVSGGTNIFDGVGYTSATYTGGSSVNLSSYTSSGGGPGGGGPGGGGGRPW